MELDWLDPTSLDSHGVVSLAECLDHGLTRSDVARLVRRGLLRKMLPRVYRTPGAAASFQQALWAAHKWAGKSAVFSHRTALTLRKWPVEPGRYVDMTTMNRTKSPTAWLNLIVTRRDPFDGAGSIGGLPVTGAGRSLMDAASV